MTVNIERIRNVGFKANSPSELLKAIGEAELILRPLLSSTNENAVAYRFLMQSYTELCNYRKKLTENIKLLNTGRSSVSIDFGFFLERDFFKAKEELGFACTISKILLIEKNEIGKEVAKMQDAIFVCKKKLSSIKSRGCSENSLHFFMDFLDNLKALEVFIGNYYPLLSDDDYELFAGGLCKLRQNIIKLIESRMYRPYSTRFFKEWDSFMLEDFFAVIENFENSYYCGIRLLSKYKSKA